MSYSMTDIGDLPSFFYGIRPPTAEPLVLTFNNYTPVAALEVLYAEDVYVGPKKLFSAGLRNFSPDATF